MDAADAELSWEALQLTLTERGAVFAALLAGAAAESSLSRLSGRFGARATQGFRALLRLGGRGRRRALEQLSAELLAPLPSGVAEVHPSWVVEALRGQVPAVAAVSSAFLPAALRAALSLSVEASGYWPAATNLRLAAASFRQLPHRVSSDTSVAQAATATKMVSRLTTLPSEALEELLRRLGCLALGALSARASKGGAAPDLGHLPAPYLEWVELATHSQPSDSALIQQALDLRRWELAVAALWRSADWGTTDEALSTTPPWRQALALLGGQLLARALPADGLWRLSWRLPRELGLSLRQMASNSTVEPLLAVVEMVESWQEDRA